MWLSLPNESLIDEDVYGDGNMEGMTYAVRNVQGVQEDDLSLNNDFDQDRLVTVRSPYHLFREKYILMQQRVASLIQCGVPSSRACRQLLNLPTSPSNC
jgi:hypothetical protein